MGAHSGKPKEDGFDTCRERNSMFERQMFAKCGEKSADVDFTLKFECWEEKGAEVVQSDVSNDALLPSEDEHSFAGV